MVNEDIVRLNELWSNPELVSAAHLGWLEELVEQYPASVPLWWLYLRAVQRAEAPNFALVLHRTASISPNRSALMDWVEQPFREEIRFGLPSIEEGIDSEMEHPAEDPKGDVQTEILASEKDVSDALLENTDSVSEVGKLSNQLAGHETEPLEEQGELLEEHIEAVVHDDPKFEVSLKEIPEHSGSESTAPIEAKTEFPEHVQAALDRARQAREQIVNVRSVAKPAALESNEIGLKLPEERREDSPNSPKKLAVDPTTDEGVVEQDEAVTGGENLQEVETFEERTLVSTADELEIVKVDLASKAPLDEPYELRSPSANPQGPIDPQAKTDEDLSKLPDRVREQILRARAARAKLAEVGIVSPSNALNLKAASEVQLENSEERAQDSNEVQPSSILDQSGVQEESLQSNAVVKSEPSGERPAKKSKSNLEILSEEGTVSGDLIGQTSKQRKPKNVARDRTSTAPSPEKTSSSSPEASPTSTIGLSPFAQFVAALGAPNSAPDQGQLIDQFLAENPRITPLAKDAPAPEVRTQPDEQVTGLVTETLARMYAEQGHVAKAIQAYEILKLRVPEKSSIFAARIEALKTK